MKRVFTVLLTILFFCSVAGAVTWTPKKPNKLRPMGENLDYIKNNLTFLKALGDKIYFTKRLGVWYAGWDNTSVDNITVSGPLPVFSATDNLSDIPSLSTGQLGYDSRYGNMVVYNGSEWKRLAGDIPKCGASTRPTCDAAAMGDLYSDNVTGWLYRCDNATAWKLVTSGSGGGGVTSIKDTSGDSATGSVYIKGYTSSGVETGITTNLDATTNTLRIQNTGVLSLMPPAGTSVGLTGAISLTTPSTSGLSITKGTGNSIVFNKSTTAQDVTKTVSVYPLLVNGCSDSSATPCLYTTYSTSFVPLKKQSGISINESSFKHVLFNISNLPNLKSGTTISAVIYYRYTSIPEGTSDIHATASLALQGNTKAQAPTLYSSAIVLSVHANTTDINATSSLTIPVDSTITDTSRPMILDLKASINEPLTVGIHFIKITYTATESY